MYIHVERTSHGVVKRFLPGNAPKGLAEEKYFREVAAYQEFEHLGVGFVPQLMGHDDASFTLEIEYGGVPLNQWICAENEGQWLSVLYQLTAIDKILYQLRVNYLFSSPADVVLDEKGKVRIIDFEYTEFGKRYEHLLLAAMDHERLFEFEPRLAEKFVQRVREYIPLSHKYIWRRINYSIRGRLGLLREQSIRINK